MAERILIIQLKRIGDFILTVPALASLRQIRPNAEMVLVVPDSLVELAKCLPMVNRVIGFASGGLNAQVWGSALAGNWELCLDFSGTDRTAFLSRLSRAQLRVGYKKFAGDGMKRMAYHRLCEASVRDLHTVDFHLALLQTALGLDAPLASDLDAQASPTLNISSAIQQRVQQIMIEQGHVAGKPYVILHPGTARLEKFWLPDRWVEVAQEVHHRFGLAVCLTGTGSGIEETPLNQIRDGMLQSQIPVVDLCGKLTLPEMAAVVYGSRLIVGVDSMAMHLAALANHPQIALYGPTNPYHWRARHPQSIILKGAIDTPFTEFSPKTSGTSMELIETQRVVDAIATLL